MSKVIFNNRAYNSIEEASTHLRVSPRDLKVKLEKDRKGKEKTPDFAWDHWGFEYSSELGSTDDMVDYEMHLDSLQATTRTLEDIAQEDEEIREAEHQEIVKELAECLRLLAQLSKEEEKETAGPWVKHND